MSEVQNSNGYPFMTRKQVVARLATDAEFQVRCLNLLVERQTEDELEAKATKYTNRRGLRCSEAVWMPELAAKLRNAPDEVTAEEMARLVRVLPVYRKQLALCLRQEQLAANPDLAEKAALFGVS